MASDERCHITYKKLFDQNLDYEFLKKKNERINKLENIIDVIQEKRKINSGAVSLYFVTMHSLININFSHLETIKFHSIN